MPTLGKRFLETTRGQIVALLRRGARTVDEVAQSLGLTDNAIRSHLAALERDGLIRQEGVRRGGGVGKPAVLYEIHPEATPLFSRAYPPVLSTLVDVLVDQAPEEQVESVMREVGRRLGRSVGGKANGSFEERLNAAAAVLTALGGDVTVSSDGAEGRINGSGCPLSTVVSHRPEMCRAVESLVSEVVGAPATSCCVHGERPRCCFAVRIA